MFTNGMLETDRNVVHIHDVDASVMNSLLDFMYTGQVEITTKNVQSLMQGKASQFLSFVFYTTTYRF